MASRKSQAHWDLLNTGRINNLLDPSSAQDAATKAYVDLWKPKYAYKAADENVTSSVTFQADNHFTIAVDANSLYEIYVMLIVTGASGGDFKCQFTFPANCDDVSIGQIMLSELETTITDSLGNWSGAVGDTSSPTATLIMGTITSQRSTGLVLGSIDTGATAGNFVMEWAQNSSSGTATSVKKGSFMRLTKIA